MIEALMQQAFAAHRAGRLDDALAAYGRVLEVAPDLPEALNYAGVAHYQGGRHALAEACLRRAIAREARPDFRFNLASVLRDAGQVEAAIEEFRAASMARPAPRGAATNLGNLLAEGGRHREALQAFEQALQEDPADAFALNGAAASQARCGDADSAERLYRQALSIRPGYVEALINLARLCGETGRPGECTELTMALRSSGSLSAAHWRELGAILGRLGDHAGALSCFGAAHAAAPNDLRAWAGWATELLETWQHDSAWREVEGILAGPITDPECLQRVLMTTLYFDRLAPERLRALHADYGRLLDPTGGLVPAPFAGDGGATGAEVPRLRIGFVSGDFRAHACMSFALPLFANLDRRRVAIHLYETAGRADAVTERLRSLADGWRNLRGLTSREAAQWIRDDRIDALVDISGHSDGNRLPIFAHRPAPLAATWLGYPATTGLASIDLRMTDAIADPPGEADAHCVEELARLAPSFLCYAPSGPLPPIDAPPSGAVVFGSFNNLAKVTPEVLALWLDLLRAVPGAILRLKARSLGDPATRKRITEFAKARGVPADRLMLDGWCSSDDHLRGYLALDIALDPFPYNGTTTTCEALSMGVPVVTLRGSSHRARVGASLLTQLDCGQWIADTPAAYRQVAIGLAADIEALRRGRQALRDRFLASPICDGPRFAASFEAVLRERLFQGRAAPGGGTAE